jgi:hypothetical protein
MRIPQRHKGAKAEVQYIIEIKHSLKGSSCRCAQTEERIRKLEGKTIEIIQYENQKKKKKK